MNYFKKKVMVTGGAGFIGSALVRELLSEKAEVVVFDNFAAGDYNNLSEIQSQIKVLEGSILDNNFESVLRKNDIEYVFNLAAEPYIPHCYDKPMEFFDVNAKGTLNVLLACKEAGVKRTVQYSSSEVYGDAQYTPMDEKHPTLPRSTYAVSKLAADRLCYTIYHEQGVPVIILRQFNCYGPRETFPYVIPELISQISAGQVVELGNIHARRDFTYVKDAAKGALELMKHKSAEGDVFNLGSGRDYSIEELARIIGRLFGRENIKLNVVKDRLRPLDVDRLQCDYSKARKLMGYKPKIGLEEGLKRTIDWFIEKDKKWIWELKIGPGSRIWKHGSG